MFYCIGIGLLGLWMEWIVRANQTLVVNPFFNHCLFLSSVRPLHFRIGLRVHTCNLSTCAVFEVSSFFD